ncbi:MAG: carbon monoxide dehydrogenase subunit G, partial [Arenicella sp.]
MKNFNFLNVLALSCALFLGVKAADAQCTPRSNFYFGEILPNAGCGIFNNVNPYSPGEYFRMPVLLGGSYSISTCGSPIDTQIMLYQGNTTATTFGYNDDNGPICAGTASSIDFVPTFTDYVRADVRQFNCLPGGSSSITVGVRQNNNLVITSSAVDMCQGDTRALTATPATVVGVPQLNSGDVGSFSGTGVAGTTFTAPNPAGASQSYTLTYTFGYCTTNQVINVFSTPTTAAAGGDQTVCAATATLAGNAPTIGNGIWTVASGPGAITTPTSATSGVTGLVAGSPTTFTWTITNGPCTGSTDNIVISRDAAPTTADAGTPQDVCVNPGTATLAANTATVGAGLWTLTAGAGTITTAADPASGLTGLGSGANTFTWTISNGVCTPSTDAVVITADPEPTAAAAGGDQTVCAATASLAGNAPTIGTGLWTVASGPGAVTTPTSATSGVTGLVAGTPTTFTWTVTSGTCPVSTDDVIITTDEAPTASDAGIAQNVCVNPGTATLAGNTATVGSGLWTLTTGTGTITTAADPASGLTGLGSGANTFTWTISNGVCTPSSDAVVITADPEASIADAGPDQVDICGTSTVLQGNIPAIGIGTWTIVSGPGVVATPGAANSSVTGLTSSTATVVEWSIASGTCLPSTDQITVTVEAIAPVAVLATLADLTDPCSVNPTIPLSNDNCAGVVAGTPDVTLPVTGQGLTVVTWTYDDGSGNISTQTQNVTITDVTAPVLDNATLADLTDPCSVTPTVPTAVDDCLGAMNGVPDVSFPITVGGLTVITWTYADSAGNSVTQTQNVTISDVTAPVLDVATLTDITDPCSVNPVAPTATDDCLGIMNGVPDVSLPVMISGLTVITWTFTDSSGNSVSQTQNVTITDFNAPVPDLATLPDINDGCSANPVPPTAVDDCIGAMNGVADVTLPMYTVGTTVITWTFADSAGNSVTQTQNVTIGGDVTDPIPDLATLPDVTDVCSSNPTPPTATDDCLGLMNGVPDVTMPIVAQGLTVVTWTFADSAGNSVTQVQNVTLTDITDPVPDSTSLLDFTSCLEATPIAPTATDDCLGT